MVNLPRLHSVRGIKVLCLKKILLSTIHLGPRPSDDNDDDDDDDGDDGDADDEDDDGQPPPALHRVQQQYSVHAPPRHKPPAKKIYPFFWSWLVFAEVLLSKNHL